MFEIENELFEYLKKNQIEEAITICESRLKSLPQSKLQEIIGKSFIKDKSRLLNFLNVFFDKSEKYLQKEFKENTKSIYTETEDFTCNFSGLTMSFFGFINYYGLEETDWLAEFDYFEHNNEFEIKEAKDVINIWKYHEQYEQEDFEDQFNYAYYLTILRVQELFKHTIIEGKVLNSNWSKIPFLITCHDSEFIFDSKNI